MENPSSIKINYFVGCVCVCGSCMAVAEGWGGASISVFNVKMTVKKIFVFNLNIFT